MKSGGRQTIGSQSNPGWALALLVFLNVLFLSPAFGAPAEQEGGGKADSLVKADALIKEATTQLNDGNPDKAIELAGEAVKAAQSYPESYDALGHMLLKAGKIDEAINAFDTALKINPRMRTSKTGMGLALMQKGDLPGAEAVLKEALLLNPYPAMTHYALGLVYEKMNNYEQAVLHFKEGIRTFKSGKR